jgi:hypothetical protein
MLQREKPAPRFWMNRSELIFFLLLLAAFLLGASSVEGGRARLLSLTPMNPLEAPTLHSESQRGFQGVNTESGSRIRLDAIPYI